MIRLYLILLPVLIVGCSTTSQNNINGNLIFYIKTTEGAFSGIKEKEEGFFFYQDDMGIINCYEYKGGEIVDVLGDGSASKELVSEIATIKLTDFDFNQEHKKAREKFDFENKEKYKLENERGKKAGLEEIFVLAPFTLDGAEYEIYANFMGTSFKFKAWNPSADIEFYAEREEGFDRLLQWISAFTDYYGRAKIAY